MRKKRSFYGFKSLDAKVKIQSASITNGTNQSNKSQRKKIEKIKITEELPQVPLGNLYMRVNKQWLHKGTMCRMCGLLINDPIVLDKHRYICKAINKRDEE